MKKCGKYLVKYVRMYHMLHYS